MLEDKVDKQKWCPVRVGSLQTQSQKREGGQKMELQKKFRRWWTTSNPAIWGFAVLYKT